MCVTVKLVSSVHTQVNSENCSLCVTVELVASVHTQVNIRKKKAATIRKVCTTCPKIASTALEIFVFLFYDKFVYCTLDIANINKINKTIFHVSKILLKHKYINVLIQFSYYSVNAHNLNYVSSSLYCENKIVWKSIRLSHYLKS